MQRVWLLNWNNITYDKDFTAWFVALLNQFVASWFWVSWTWASAEILPWKALIECTRSNGEKIMSFFENTENVPVDMTGTKKIYIEVTQAKIDDWSLNAEDGTGIAIIKTGASYPENNYMPLYSIVSWIVTNEMPTMTIKSVNVDWKIIQDKWSDIASASTVDLTSATWNTVHVTGTTSITSFWNVQAWAIFNIIFDWSLELTHNATSLMLPTWANIQTLAWDSMIIVSEWSWNWKVVLYQRYNWSPLVSTTVASTISSWTAWENITSWNALVYWYKWLTYTFDWTTIDTAVWTVTANVTQNNSLLIMAPKNSAIFARKAETVQNFNESIDIEFDLTTAIWGWLDTWNVFGRFCIYFDASNYITAYIRLNDYSNNTAVWIQVVQGGSSVYNVEGANFWTWGSFTKKMKLIYNKITGGVKLFYWEVWQTPTIQVWTEYITSFTWTYKLVLTESDSSNAYMTTYVYLDNLSFTLLWTKYILKSNASNEYWLDFIWFAKNTISSWWTVNFDTAWVNNAQTWLTAWVKQYLTNTPWVIWSTPWSNIVEVWLALNTTDILINAMPWSKTTWEKTQVAWASPYRYQNTTWKNIMLSITWGTVSQVAFSRDNTNYYQTSGATNTFIILGVNDYCKITYTVAPVLKIFTI